MKNNEGTEKVVNLLFEKEISTNALEVEAVFGPEGIMADMFKGYKPREGQKVAIPLVWDALEENKHCLLEGPCGFGKTFAYLFPSMMESVKRGKRVVIATSGITLQDQLYKKDAPFMADVIKKYTGRDISIGYIKGRQNYLCNRKIAEIGFSINNGGNIIDKEKYEQLVWFYNSTITGDKDELDFVPDFNIWSEVCANSDDCDSKSCGFNTECFYHKSKEGASSNNIVITNYHILLADKAIGGHLLGNYDILVCDEAHELPSIVRDSTEGKFALSSLSDLRKRVSALNKYADIVDAVMVKTSLEEAINPSVAYIQTVSNNLSYLKPGDTGLIEGVLESKLYGWESAFNALMKLESMLDDYSSEFSDDDSENYRGVYRILSNMKSSVKALASTLQEVAGGYSMDDDPENIVRYIELNKKGMVELKKKVKKVGDLFEDMFVCSQGFEIPLSIVFTSATISTGGNFAYIKEQLGIKSKYETFEYIGVSPFNLTEQELWYLPPAAKNGNDQQFNNRMLQDFLEVAVSCNGGVLGLFTSVYNMRAASKFLMDNLPTNSPIEILTQGEMPREKLINVFRQEKDSVLIGTKSLFTGVDVQGSALRCVFIDKLPFPSLGDPVQQALNKEPGAFFKYSIPSMIIDLKQAVGRGVRSTTDKCVIVIADNRLSTANYKGSIFGSFNYPKTGSRNIDDVVNFIERM